ncbi:MspA family porin [Nocardia sp. NPDC051570]|uniref:MspA family porin n=1 Tax=Nocardia sp. NPDC051570 TaxID=3364324 RepID=UPI0037B5AA1B
MVSRAGGWLAGAGGVLAVLTLGSAVAQADTVAPLPDGREALTTATGVQVDLTRTGEQAVIAPSLAGNGMSRTASVSGTIFAKVDNATKGTLVTGYLVGCQVDLSGGLSLSGDMYVSPSALTPELAPSINLVPGGVSTVALDTKQLDPAARAVGIGYADRGIQISGCGGYAQARAFTTLTVINAQGSAEVTLYGQPFSVG